MSARSKQLAKAPRNVVLVGDVRKELERLPDDSIDCVVTSPPYFQLRDYGMSNQMGLESSVDQWVDELRVVMGGIARVLKPSGSVWLNLSDSFSRHERYGAPPKSLLLGPEQVALALVRDGWTVRNKVIWAKTNTMPTSVRDRLSCTWEVVYFLTRTRHYYFDLDAIRIPHRSARQRPKGAAAPAEVAPRPEWAGPLAGNNSGLARLKAQGLVGHPLGKNPGDVWQMSASNFRGQHFATFPAGLVERPLLATCPERTCTSCGRPWQREPSLRKGQLLLRRNLRPTCDCGSSWQPGLVLDPFFGSGTTGLVAEKHRRDWLGIELNPAFARLASERIGGARQNREPPEEQPRAA
jgi:site-specific DNA-methyltransferase (adenine-specific)